MGPIFRAVADHAVLVEFGTEISTPVHEAVVRLDRALAAAPFAGFGEAIPGFVNLLVDFDPMVTDHALVEAHLRGLLLHPVAASRAAALREVLVCYDDDFAPDLAEVAARTGMSREAVIAAHLAGRYEMFMYGFAPGYADPAGPKARAGAGDCGGQRDYRGAAVSGDDDGNADRVVDHRTLAHSGADRRCGAAVPV